MMLHGPCGEASPSHLYPDWGTLWRERSPTERMRRKETRLFWMCSIKFTRIIPGTFRVDFPIRMREFAPDLPPVFLDVECIDQWPPFNTETVVIACLHSDRHRKMERNTLPSAPFTFYPAICPCLCLHTLSLLKVDCCPCGPSWNTQEEGEMDRTVSGNTQVDVFLKRIGGQHFNAHRGSGNLCGHHAWSIDQCD